MTVLVDSSVFIQVQKLPNSRASEELRDLIASGEAAVTGPVVVEYVRGARSPQQIEFLTRSVLSIHYLDTDRQAWVIAARISNRLMRSGNRISVPDAAIAATAIRHDVPLYTLDKGFSRIPELKLYESSLT